MSWRFLRTLTISASRSSRANHCTHFQKQTAQIITDTVRRMCQAAMVDITHTASRMPSHTVTTRRSTDTTRSASTMDTRHPPTTARTCSTSTTLRLTTRPPNCIQASISRPNCTRSTTCLKRPTLSRPPIRNEQDERIKEPNGWANRIDQFRFISLNLVKMFFSLKSVEMVSRAFSVKTLIALWTSVPNGSERCW